MDNTIKKLDDETKHYMGHNMHQDTVIVMCPSKSMAPVLWPVKPSTSINLENCYGSTFVCSSNWVTASCLQYNYITTPLNHSHILAFFCRAFHGSCKVWRQKMSCDIHFYAVRSFSKVDAFGLFRYQSVSLNSTMK